MKYSDVQMPSDLYLFMKENIHYGFVSNYDYCIYTRKDLNNDSLCEEILYDSYFLQTPSELLKNGYGLCYDQVELERKWFLEHGYSVRTYFSNCHNHYQDRDHYCLFERCFKSWNGIDSFQTIEDALRYYKERQVLEKNNELGYDDIIINRYEMPNFHMGFMDFISYAEKPYCKLKSDKRRF